MKPHELGPAPGARTESKRVGRGTGSGLGKTSGRGHKGQKARSGGSIKPGFEGGQTTLIVRLPRRGFTNIFAKVYTQINVGRLDVFEDGTVVTPELLLEKRIIRKLNDGVKVLGKGELTHRITVRATKFTGGAKEKIEAAGGSIEVI